VNFNVGQRQGNAVKSIARVHPRQIPEFDQEEFNKARIDFDQFEVWHI
jgi:hypothetical protein